MPVSVPNEPKIHTTKYQNFRGVDYTNDPSNVWYRRSPTGVNMLPGLDGNPFKRNGWKIEFTSEDFAKAKYEAYDEYDPTKDYFEEDICKRTTYGMTLLYRCTANALHEAWDGSKWVGFNVGDHITQYKVDYFELGGTEYLWIYTAEGCFVYGDSLKYVGESYQIGDDKPYDYSKGITYDVGDYCRHSNKTYRCKEKITTPETWTSSKWLEVSDDDCHSRFPKRGAGVDYSKSFFFEGGGRAGYYLFVDDKMFWFDGDKLHEAKPTIPIVITMAETTGVGTELQNVNMLTEWRAVDYRCDGVATTYLVLGGVDAILNVYTINADGTMTPNYNWDMPNNGQLDFTSPPAKTHDNEPSMRVIYRSANATITQDTAYTAAYSVKVTKATSEITQQEYRNGAWQDGLHGFTTPVYTNETVATIPLVNAKKPISVQADTRGSSASSAPWSQNVSTVETTVDAYGSTVVAKSRNDGKDLFETYYGATVAPGVAVGGVKTTVTYDQFDSTHRNKVVTTLKYVSPQIRLKYTQWNLTSTGTGTHRTAFFASSKALVFGNGIINQVFLTASKYDNFSTRVWYSAATDPLYFPDTNYIEVGATDKHIMGLIKVDDYLGIIKQGSATDTSVYLAYATSFEDITTYAVKQSVNGIGAVSNGAFNILNGEPLFLSAEGVMGIEPAEDESRKLRNRSYYVNRKLLEEPSLEPAFSFVFDGMYWLCVNDHCYVLDGSQKVSWENTKTNLQYECYYLENIPARCFARKDGMLWFIDTHDNLCRFKGNNEANRFVDEYYSVQSDVEEVINGFDANNVYVSLTDPADMQVPTSSILKLQYPTGTEMEWNDSIRDSLYSDGITFTVSGCRQEYPDMQLLLVVKYIVDVDGTSYESNVWTVEDMEPDTEITIPPGESFFDDIPDVEENATYRVRFLYFGEHEAQANDIIYTFEEIRNPGHYYNELFYTITDATDGTATLGHGIPIKAVWGTIADDDDAAHYYKNLQKKGSVVSLMPMSNNGVRVYIIPDEKDRVFVGETTAGNHVLPFNYYLRKKIKKYKRLQIVCENDTYDCGFGVDEIIKSYTVGNYAKR